MKTCRKGARGSVDLYTARTEAEHRKGAMMRGPLIQTEARTILNRGISETKKETALRMLKMGKLTVDEIAEYSALSVAEVEPLANPQTI